MAFHCELCGDDHEGLPDLGFDAPDPYLAVPENERDARTTLTPDRCTVEEDDGIHYFVRAVISIPVHGEDEPFGIGAWVSQSQKNFDRYSDGEEMEPTFGWLVNHITFYEPTTMLLKTRLHFRGEGMRPEVELEPTDHPLAIEQREGISIERAWSIVHQYMH
ncbi:MAG TPA: DUF2199 domain-containing protein [Labilithrix sp.]|jgi:hypothetical protein